ncbi:MAG TPA: aminotransferase class V-fold PLP-dependent enzyme [Woeseiaceae bacterium]|nr:aminotransferase class V-fold PLP-dependent enzyme [Woeseiaceae bacterium]
MPGLVPKSDFIALEGITNLVAGGEPPLLKMHRKAFEDYAADKARGYAGYWQHWAINEEVRSLVAGLLHMQADDISLVGSASEGISQVISSIDWQPGDNAVTSAIEYASGRFAFSGLQKFGVDARMVEPDRWHVDIEKLVDACDDRTRLMYVSQVSYRTGQLLHIQRLSTELKARGIPLLNDASHALGVTPVDGQQADFTVCAGYKWLLGTQTGIFAWNRKRRPTFEPKGIGWRSAIVDEASSRIVPRHDANRVQVGNSNHLDVYLLRESLQYLRAIGIDRIRRHVIRLGDLLIEALQGLDLEIMTPESRDGRAGNICFAHPDPARLVELAAAENILFWGDDGRIRVSIHLFNDEDDIETLIEFLRRNRTHLR